MEQAAEGGAARESEKLPAKAAVVKAATVKPSVIKAWPAAYDDAATKYGTADADEIPIPGHPIAVTPVAADPCIARSRACRNCDRTRAKINADASCRSGRCTHCQRAHCQSRSQKELFHAAHNPSIPCGPFYQSALRLAHHLEACFLLPLELAVLQMQTLRLRKVAAVNENKRPQLFDGFVLSAAAFFWRMRSRGRRDILEKRTVLLLTLLNS